jgi:type IV secretion system protein VirB5
MAAALTWLGNSSKLVPYVVEVDKLGQAMAFGPAVELSRLDQRLYRFQLGLLVSGLRTIHPDRVSQRRSLQSAYAYLAEPAATYVANYFRDHNPFTATGAVTVQVTSVLRLGQDDSSWQVQWYEDHYATDGRKTARGYFQATLQVQLRPPKASEIPLTNPLGLYVTQIDWTQMPTTTMETPPP